MNPLHVLSWKLYDHCLDAVQPRSAIDIGANIGGYVHTMLAHGINDITAIEPLPIPFAELSKRFSDDSRVKCLNVAAGRSKDILRGVTVLEAWTLGKPGDGGFGTNANYVGTPLLDIPVIPVDDLNLRPGIIKLDVDGHELRVIQGMLQTLKECSPPILCEFSLYLTRLGHSAKDFVEQILSLDYVIAAMDGSLICRTWKEVEPWFPGRETSFDVMLMPKNKPELLCSI